MAIVVLVFVAFLLLNGASASDELCLTPGCLTTTLLVLQNVNFSADPCDDFYDFACGNYFARTMSLDESIDDLPSSNDVADGLGVASLINLKSSPGIYDPIYVDADNSVQETLQDLLRQWKINKTAMPDVDRNAFAFYQACVSSGRSRTSTGYRLGADFIHNKVAKVIAPGSGFDFGSTSSDPSPKTFNASVEEMIAASIDFSGQNSAFFKYSIERGYYNASLHRMWISSPTSTFYFGDSSWYSPSSSSTEQRWKAMYLSFLKDFAWWLSEKGDYSGQLLDDLLQFELNLAKLTPVNNYDYDLGQDGAEVTVAEMNRLAPAFNWTRIFSVWGRRYNVSALTALDSVANFKFYVYGVSYFKNLSNYLTNYLQDATKRKAVQNYIILTSLKPYLGNIPGPFSNIYLNLTSPSSLLKCDDDAVKVCADQTKTYFGELMARNYLKRFDKDGEMKKYAERMAETVRRTFIENNLKLARQTWLPEDLAQRLERKARNLQFIMGYPDRAVNISALNQRYSVYGRLQEDDYLGDLLKITSGANKFTFQALDIPDTDPVNPEDLSELPMDVNGQHIVNAVYVTGGHFEEPFFGLDYPKALNWAVFGQTLSHEFSHAFGKNGLDWGVDGELLPKNMRNISSYPEMQKRMKCLVDQYSTFSFYPGIQLDGTKTLNEDFADVSGLQLAYNSFKADIGDSKIGVVELPISSTVMRADRPGLTNEQLFFVSDAIAYCAVQQKSLIQRYVRRNNHSPYKARVTAMMRNSEAFAGAFKCSPNSRMNPVDKCRIW